MWGDRRGTNRCCQADGAEQHTRPSAPCPRTLGCRLNTSSQRVNQPASRGVGGVGDQLSKGPTDLRLDVRTRVPRRTRDARARVCAQRMNIDQPSTMRRDLLKRYIRTYIHLFENCENTKTKRNLKVLLKMSISGKPVALIGKNARKNYFNCCCYC